ncbi:MAG: site-specific integrase [Chloroflexi bacterium]|nr:site-specific integrase [Chloroflexota bacterium]
MTTIQRIKGQPGASYEVLFVDQHGHLIVALTEWYRIRSTLGPASTRDTYLSCLLPFFAFLSETGSAWNASPEQLRPVLTNFYRERFCCLVRPERGLESIAVVPTRDTPLQESTLQVFRSALRDFYLIMRDEGLYAFSHPLTSEALLTLKRLHDQSIANSGAPDHAGIRGETRGRSRRQPTAFIRYPKAREWRPDLRKELADVRMGIHKVLDALMECPHISCREKIVLELLRNTGARLHEIVGLSVGGYRNEGIAGQAQVVSKGSLGREIKTIYFAHNPKVIHLLTQYLNRYRPQVDPQRRARFAELDATAPVLLTERGTPYSVKCFYYHWYKYYPQFRSLCPVVFSPHDIRHLFISEFLILLRETCGAGTDHFDAERYQREREAFGSTIMGWRSAHTIDIYDHSRDAEHTLEVLAHMQQQLAERSYLNLGGVSPNDLSAGGGSTGSLPNTEASERNETVWFHDAETLAWIQQMQQQ